MSLCRIYNKDGREIKSFDPDQMLNEKPAITVGSSASSSISLEGAEGIDDSVDPVHFAIIRRDGAVFAVEGPGARAFIYDNAFVHEVNLLPGTAFSFGSCTFSVAPESLESSFAVIFEKKEGGAAFQILMEGENSILMDASGALKVNDFAAGTLLAKIMITKDGVLSVCNMQSPGSKKTTSEYTVIEPYDVFFCNGLKLCLCHKNEAQKAVASGRAFVRSSFKLKLALVASLLVVAGLLALIAMKESSGASASAAISKELQMKEALKQKQAIKDAPEQKRLMWEFVKNGNTLAALKIVEDSPAFKEDEKKLLRKVLTDENSRVSLLKLYNDKLALFYSPDSDIVLYMIPTLSANVEMLDSEVRYWDSAIKRIKRELDEIAVLKNDDYKANSHFLTHADELLGELEKMRTFYQQIQEVNALKNKEKWDEIPAALVKYKFMEKAGTNKNALSIVSQLDQAAQFHIHEVLALKSKFQKGDFLTLNFKECRKLTDELVKKADALKESGNTVLDYPMIDERIEHVRLFIDLAEQLKNSYDKWKLSETDLESASSVVSAIEKLKVISSGNDVQNRCNEIRGELVANLTRRVKALSQEVQTGSAPALGKIDHLLDFASIVDPLDLSGNRNVLNKDRKTIVRRLKDTYGHLYQAYRTSVAENDLGGAKKTLEKMIALGPLDEKFYVWASKEIKKY